MAIGMWQRRQEIAYLTNPEYKEIGWRPGLSRWGWSNLVALVVIAIGLVTFVWIAAGS